MYKLSLRTQHQFTAGQTSIDNVTTPGQSETILVSIERYDDTRWETSMTSTLRILDSNLDEVGTKKMLPTVLGEEVSTYANRSDPRKLNAITAGNILMFDTLVGSQALYTIQFCRNLTHSSHPMQ